MTKCTRSIPSRKLVRIHVDPNTKPVLMKSICRVNDAIITHPPGIMPKFCLTSSTRHMYMPCQSTVIYRPLSIYQYSYMVPRFQEKLLYLVVFYWCPCVSRDLRDKNSINFQFYPDTFETMLAFGIVTYKVKWQICESSHTVERRSKNP